MSTAIGYRVKVWWYHSHIDEPAETNLELLGAIIITKKGMAKRDGSPKDVQREFVVAFMVFDEDKGKERGLMHSIKGRIFGNLKGLVMNKGEKVRAGMSSGWATRSRGCARFQSGSDGAGQHR